MRSSLPNTRRIPSGRPRREAKSVEPSLLAKTILIPLFFAVVGVILGSFGTSAIESAKSADALRRFVLTELYKPFAENAVRCIQKRSDLLGLYMQTLLVFKHASTSLDLATFTTPRVPVHTDDDLSKQLKALPISQAIVHLQKATDSEPELAICINTVANQADVLGIALSKTVETDAILDQHNQRVEKTKNKYPQRLTDLESESFNAYYAAIDARARVLALKAKRSLKYDQQDIDAMSDLKKTMSTYLSRATESVNFQLEMTHIERDTHQQITRLFFDDLNRKFKTSPFWFGK